MIKSREVPLESNAVDTPAKAEDTLPFNSPTPSHFFASEKVRGSGAIKW